MADNNAHWPATHGRCAGEGVGGWRTIMLTGLLQTGAESQVLMLELRPSNVINPASSL